MGRKDEGGSDVPLDREMCAESVAFWRVHAAVKWVRRMVIGLENGVEGGWLIQKLADAHRLSLNY